jgi:hypothetical protein
LFRWSLRRGGGGGQEPVSPRCRFVHVYQDPPPLGSFPATLEGSRNIFIVVVATHIEPDFAINNFIISRGRIIIP